MTPGCGRAAERPAGGVRQHVGMTTTSARPAADVLAAFENAKGSCPSARACAVRRRGRGRGARAATPGGRHVPRPLDDPARRRRPGRRGHGPDRGPPPGQRSEQPGWDFHDPETVDPAVGRMDTLPTFRLHAARGGPGGPRGGTGRKVPRRSPRCGAAGSASSSSTAGHTDEHATADYEGLGPARRRRRAAPHPRRVPRRVRRVDGTGTACTSGHSRPGRFTEVSVCDSLRVLRRTGAGDLRARLGSPGVVRRSGSRWL